MNLRRALASIILGGVSVFGLNEGTKADITINLNQPLKVYNSPIYDQNVGELPDNVEYLYEGQKFVTGIHLSDSLGLQDIVNVGAYVDDTLECESRLDRAYSNNIEADYVSTLTVETNTSMSGFYELSIRAQGVSGWSNTISLGYFHLNERNPDAVMTAWGPLEFYSDTGEKLPENTSRLFENYHIKSQVRVTHNEDIRRIEGIIEGMFAIIPELGDYWRLNKQLIDTNNTNESTYYLDIPIRKQKGLYDLNVQISDVYGNYDNQELGRFYFNTIPEPSTLGFLGLGFLGFLANKRRKEKLNYAK